MEGGCRCGSVRFRIAVEPLITMACHCTGCQRMTASAFSLSALVRDEDFVIVAGTLEIGGLHGAARHHHCGRCKSWLFTRPPGMDAFVNVRPTMLDDPGAFAEPFIETFTDEKIAWATTPARHSFATLPPEDAFGDLIADYAAVRGRR